MNLFELYEIAETVTFGPVENRALEERLHKMEQEAMAPSEIRIEEFLSRSYNL